ncbi:OmpA family protein [Roseospira marina]|nr:OmpA family protein [Roseospira marina]MBB4313163.1 OOP family OmpA-OmpF porin [Roseospira marina]MBB5086096.1 OOP family OmpA-OmpF porin [Roseospira marina]
MPLNTMSLTPVAAGVAVVCLGLASPAHSQWGFGAVDAMRSVDISADAPTFREQAIRYYKQFSLFEADEMADWYDAEYFAEKGVALAHGEPIAPETVEDQGIEPGLERTRLERARAALIRVLETDGPAIAPKASAYALVSYDCWVEQVQEGHQAAHIQACRSQFRDAMTVIAAYDAGATPDVVAETVVYFGFDQATLTSDAQDALRALETQLDDPDAVSLRVIGHADRAGPADYNRDLSERRAVAVAEALTDMGLRVDQIDTLAMAGAGETAPAVETGDGVREPRNRRVVVQAVWREAADHPVAMASAGDVVLESDLW